MQEQEWVGGGEPWNPPTSEVVPANGSYTFGVRLLTAPNVAGIDDTLLHAGKAAVHGVPGRTWTLYKPSSLQATHT